MVHSYFLGRYSDVAKCGGIYDTLFTGIHAQRQTLFAASLPTSNPSEPSEPSKPSEPSEPSKPSELIILWFYFFCRFGNR